MSEITTNAEILPLHIGSSGDSVLVDHLHRPEGGSSEESVEESHLTPLNVLNSSLSISSTTWRPPTPPRGLLSAVEGETAARPPSLSSKLSSMARRVVLNIGGVDTSVALSAADELLLSDTKEHPLSSSGSPQLPQNLYDLRRKAGLIRTRSNPLEIKSVSSDEYHSRRNKNGYRNIVGQTVVAQKSSPRASLFSSRKHAQDNNYDSNHAFSSLAPYQDDIESSQHQLLTNHTSTSLLAPQDAQLITSYTSLPDPDDDNSVLATNKIRKQCNAFYDVDEVCNNVSSFPSPLKNINLMMAGLQQQQQQHPNTSTAANNSSSRERLFFDNNLPSLSTTNNHIPTHRRSNSARYFRELLSSTIQNNSNKRGMEYYCGGLENIVNWTDQTMVPEPCALTPLPSGVVDVDVSTNSTLYELNRHTGRVQIHLPKDDVRLVMDPNLEAGILCVVVTEDESKFQLYHTNSTVGAAKGRPTHTSRPDESQKVPPLTYILTVDDDLYKRVLNELAERWSQPFGLYFCTHETDETSRVSPWFAGMILSVILIAMFIIVLVIQDD